MNNEEDDTSLVLTQRTEESEESDSSEDSDEYIYTEVEIFEDTLKKICNNIHKKIGSCLLENIYQNVLYMELSKHFRNYDIKFEEKIPITYESFILTYKSLDLIIYKKNNNIPFIILELKSVDKSKLDISQLCNYMKITKCELGYLVNFERNSEHPTDFCKSVEVTNLMGTCSYKKVVENNVTISKFKKIKDF